MKKLRISQLVRDIRRLAALEPDKIARSLNFDAEGNCVCIVGCAMAQQGVVPADLRGGPGENCSFGAIYNSDMSLFEIVHSYRTERQVAWINTVQVRQDNKHTWAAAVAYADRNPS